MFVEKPVQVKVKEDLGNGHYNIFGAIAFQDKLICGDTGFVIDLNADYIEVTSLCWVDISDAIIGE